jgi:hypothetical protein
MPCGKESTEKEVISYPVKHNSTSFPDAPSAGKSSSPLRDCSLAPGNHCGNLGVDSNWQQGKK